MSQVTKKGATSPQMNMTPMIDVTFQLIIFFMLVNTISSTEVVEMIVPKIHEPKVKELTDEKRVTINVAVKPEIGKERGPNDDPWAFGSEVAYVQIGFDKYLPEDLERLTDDLKKLKEERDASGKELQLVLRADGALHYLQLQPVMQHITMAGIETVNIVAFMPKQGPDNAKVN